VALPVTAWSPHTDRFVEVYNLTTDDWQMNNLASDTDPTQAQLKTRLHKWFECKGDQCP
jgi:hypothetical protein